MCLLSKMSCLLFNVAIVNFSGLRLSNLACIVKVAGALFLWGNNLVVVHVDLVYSVVLFSAI